MANPIDSEKLFRKIDDILREINCFDKVKVKITSKEKTNIINKIPTLCINPKNVFISSGDEDHIDILIRKEIYRAEYRLRTIIPVFLEELLINKRLVKEGHGEKLESLYFIELFDFMTKEINDKEKYMKVNIPWLSFHGLDNGKAEDFKNILRRFETPAHIKDSTNNLFELSKTPYMKSQDIIKEVSSLNADIEL